MDYRPSESLKLLAEELSSLLVSRNGDTGKKAHLFRQMGITTEKEAVGPAARMMPGGSADQIGVWKRTIRNGHPVYRRDVNDQFEWVFWADVNEIHPRGSKRRVILLGESVARGYLYDPHYNVARELEAILTGRDATANTEVVDLARTNLGLDGLCAIMQSCVALEPDAVVIFAGNNWDPALMGSINEDEYEKIGDLFCTEGFASVKSYIERKFAQLVTRFLERVSDTLFKKGIPVVIVIPEFNLKEWRSNNIEQGLLWLPAEKIEAWIRAVTDARAARTRNDTGLLGSAAKEMVATNPSHPLGHEFLGDFFCLKDQYSEARQEYELARDLVMFAGGVTTPRCYRLIREVIVRDAPASGIRVVDLPQIFSNEFPANIPNRHLFLDYCHLTVEGIKLAMRYTAQVVTTILTGKEIPVESIGASDLYPGNDTLAAAHFGAAIHNAHLGQPKEILQYHCSKAVRYSSKIKAPMREFIDFSTRRAPTDLCRTFERIILSGELRIYEGAVLSLCHPEGRKLMDIDLVNSIVEAFGNEEQGIDDRICGLRVSEHGIGAEPVNLLDSFFSTTHYNAYIGEPDMILFSARTTESCFNVVVPENTGGINLTISCRTPGREGEGKFIRIYGNDKAKPVAEIPMSRNWVSWSFTIEGNQLTTGVNRLFVHWPYSFKPLAAGNAHSSYTLVKLMYPVLGEISSFLAVNRPE